MGGFPHAVPWINIWRITISIFLSIIWKGIHDCKAGRYPSNAVSACGPVPQVQGLDGLVLSVGPARAWVAGAVLTLAARVLCGLKTAAIQRQYEQAERVE